MISTARSHSSTASAACRHSIGYPTLSAALTATARAAARARSGSWPNSHSWDLFAAERYRRGETGILSYEAYNPFRHRQPGPYA